MLFPWFVFEKEGCVENGSYTQLMCHEMLCLEVKKMDEISQSNIII